MGLGLRLSAYPIRRLELWGGSGLGTGAVVDASGSTDEPGIYVDFAAGAFYPLRPLAVGLAGTYRFSITDERPDLLVIAASVRLDFGE